MWVEAEAYSIQHGYLLSRYLSMALGPSYLSQVLTEPFPIPGDYPFRTIHRPLFNITLSLLTQILFFPCCTLGRFLLKLQRLNSDVTSSSVIPSGTVLLLVTPWASNILYIFLKHGLHWVIVICPHSFLPTSFLTMCSLEPEVESNWCLHA